MKLTIGIIFYLVIAHSRSEDINWTAKWIGAPKNLQPAALSNLSEIDNAVIKSHPGLKPVLIFRKTFQINNPVSRAILFCAAKGAFQGYLTEQTPLTYRNFYPTLTPGWTDYNKTIQYYTFDVTNTIRYHVNHTLGIMVGSGWYSGYIGNKYNTYGSEESALVELHITFENGSTTAITSDETWRVNTGEVLYSDLVHGELFYENRQQYNWTHYDYDDRNWSSVITHSSDKEIKLVEDTSPIQRLNVGSAKSSWQVGENTWTYMFDEIIYGGVILRVAQFPFTARIQVRFGESVHSDGSLYNGNYKSGLATHTYILNDPENRPDNLYLTPIFTTNSFKFVEISGYPVAFYTSEVNAFRYSQNDIVGTINSDNNLVKDLIKEIKNSILANFNSVPTNSPSSDARVGWLEPAGLFSPTAFFYFDARKFYKKWLSDIRDSQAPSGAYSNISPNLNAEGDASPGSGLTPIIIAYNFYKFYQDIDTLKENYISNKNWMEYVISNNPNLLYTKNINKDYGDFANVNAETPKEVISTAYFAYGALLMSKIAKVLNKSEDQEYYVALHKNISEAFVKAYVSSANGKINGYTQTGYTLALVSKVLPEELIPKTAQLLVDDIKTHDYHLTTGYVGTAFILPVLADNGHIDVAYKLLLQTSFPSWGYMLRNYTRGLWERWDSWTEEKGFQGSSLNGLGLGSVGSFLTQYIAGINSDDEEISFKKIVIKPYIGEGINSFTAEIDTNYGIVSGSWKILSNVFSIEIHVPKNTTGKLVLPFASQTWIRELSPGKNTFQFKLNTENHIVESELK